jgi:hypothetical protein
LRIERGTGSTGKSENSRNQRGALTAEQKGGIALSLQQREPAQVKLAYVRFLDPAHQRVKTP